MVKANAGGGRYRADVKDGFDARSIGRRVHRMWSMAEEFVPTTKAEQRRIARDGDRLYKERVAERVQTLADNARITTLDRLGENRRALRILERRLAGDR